ncbi:uncharacterized protein ATNIH1004_001335 [Aspergillus tanneri]|uniref:Uncharacterized protein n=1 Tax=Aspergillus tanneri TaxID=1220188 RepID=A0A5M9MZ65_9EURO|nr:uncharacterized protein ATNIH1004_001335 [Aspergillus tanneri]KAA8652431.1 hypothetical protein ATNIH1004_001335 [Aspergillus tanneri]
MSLMLYNVCNKRFRLFLPANRDNSFGHHIILACTAVLATSSSSILNPCSLIIFLQRRYPQMLDLSVSTQSHQFQHEKMLLDDYYDIVKEGDSLRWKFLSDPFLTVRTDPILWYLRVGIGKISSL